MSSRPSSSTLIEGILRADQVQPETEEIVIRPQRGWIGVNWGELLQFRELLLFLIWRDVKVRYKQTVLGAAWAVLQPLFSMVVFTVIFGNFAGLKSKLPPGMQDKYALFVLAALLPWQLFATGISNGGLSLVNQQSLLTKIYFPRLFVPMAIIGSALVDFTISSGVFVGLMVYYRASFSWGIVVLPVLVLLTVMATLGVGFILAALTVSYRDFRFLIPFMTQAWMYLSPVIWPSSILSGKYRWLLALNPMTGLINAYRSAVFGAKNGMPWDLPVLAVSATVAVGIFVFGLFYFRKTERRFADIA